MTEQEPAFDLLLQGGHVVDPANNIYGRIDVAIKDGKIAVKNSFRKHRTAS